MSFWEFNQTLTVRRPGTGSYVDGKWVSETETPLTIEASVQPSTPKEMESLTEGRRTHSGYTLYTDTKLQTVHDQNPDRVVIDGDDYEVLGVERWQNNVLPNYKVVVAKLDHAFP